MRVDVASRFDPPRLRRVGLAGALAGALALMASGVQGLAGVDDRLEAASEPSRGAVERNLRDGRCPTQRHHRLTDEERL